MFKKLQQRLLERHPHIWNMRLLPVLAVTVMIHLLHGLIGFCYFSGVEKMSDSLEILFFSTPFFLISGIISFLVILLWLMRVLRNNAFKSFYPAGSLYLFREFCIFLLVFFLNITYFVSFNAGFAIHGRMETDYKTAVEEGHIFQEAEVLFTQEKEEYDINSRKSPPPFPLTRRYYYEGDTAAIKSEETHTEVVTEPGTETVTVPMPAASNDTGYYYVGSDRKIYMQAFVDSVSGGYQYAYLNFSGGTYFNNDYLVTEGYLYQRGSAHAEKMLQWLRTGQKDSVLHVMNALLKICDKYSVPYHIEVNEWFRWVYNPPYFPVQYTVANPWYSRYNEADEYPPVNTATTTTAIISDDELKYNPKGFYIKDGKLSRIIQATLDIHEEPLFNGKVMIALFCTALAFAIFMYTFRITSRRIWLISIIGSALLGLLIGAISLFIAYGSRNSDSEGTAIMGFYLALILAFYLVAQFSINGSGSKTVAGVALSWLLWTLPFVPFIILAMYTMSVDNEYHIANSNNLHHRPALQIWLETHYTLYTCMSLLLYILLVLALTPLCRRWQAMGEN